MNESEVLSLLEPGQRIFIQGATGEPSCFYEALERRPEALAGVNVWACLLPGINAFDYASIHPDARQTAFMATPSLARSISTGQTTLMELPYSSIAARLATADVDLAFIHVTPPGPDGHLSFSVSCDFAPLIWRYARRTIAIINQDAPRPPRSETVPASALAGAWHCNRPFPNPRRRGSGTRALAQIGRICADLIPDGATIQSGLGEAPGAVVHALREHRNLSVHSGMITSEYRDLAQSGALHPGAHHTAGIAWGEPAFYQWLETTDMFSFRSVDFTHNAEILSSLSAFHAINSAVEIDLLGQANLQWRDNQRISSVGGAPDFMLGTRGSKGGRSIIALPAETPTGKSRIVARLTCPTVSVSSEETDTVVTEYGGVRIRGLDPEAKARALVEIAAPHHRRALMHAWEGKVV
jgi:acyl-CoA hydrolase